MVVLRNPSSGFMARPEKPLPYGVRLIITAFASLTFWSAAAAFLWSIGR